MPGGYFDGVFIRSFLRSHSGADAADHQLVWVGRVIAVRAGPTDRDFLFYYLLDRFWFLYWQLASTTAAFLAPDGISLATKATHNVFVVYEMIWTVSSSNLTVLPGQTILFMTLFLPF